MITFGQAKSCRFIADLTGTAVSLADPDLYAAALQRAVELAAKDAGNAVVIRGFQLQSGVRPHSAASVTVGVYSCDPGVS